jgi:predicted metal-binding membrane protein
VWVLRSFGYVLRSGSLPWLLIVSVTACILSLLADCWARLPEICGAVSLIGLTGSTPLLLALLSPAGLVTGWLLMVTAMMLPLLGQPINHVWSLSFRDRRPRALACFGFGYALVWLAAGASLIPLTIGLRIAAPGWKASAIALAAAILWSCSPAAQRARNRCHRLRRIGAFGWAADRDCVKQGISTGMPCAAACWAWMLIPLTTERFHFPAMLAVSLALFLERIGPPSSARWRSPPATATLSAMFRSQKVVGSL